ncbi:hypothetical protein DSL72_007106 [Monilinia vaccinii-corymbosi]|uniref:Uncharacterized protein n=1 Tax=Monilinia vaccinii-corymbosi TaxID=61207 RepID=A0A8A3PM22_9HELO|nr:hypothetical protein DSL72_007106 [Monilinia vaccinii-corymbosi]
MSNDGPRPRVPWRKPRLEDWNIPTPIIVKDEVDFQATHDYVLHLQRDYQTRPHPGAWQEREAIPMPTYVSPSMPHGTFYNTVQSQIDYHRKLVDSYHGIDPGTAVTDDTEKKAQDFPMSTANIAKAIWFRWHVVSAEQFIMIRPPYLSKYDAASPQMIKYISMLRTNLDQVEYIVLRRARQITSSIVLANVKSEEFKERCRADNGVIALAIFFSKVVTDEQLHYIYRPVWTAVDFTFVQCSDEKPPDDSSLVDRTKWHLRKFTKLGFAHLAAHYFANCLQRKGVSQEELEEKSKGARQAGSKKRETQPESGEGSSGNHTDHDDTVEDPEALNDDENPFGHYPEVEIEDSDDEGNNDDEVADRREYLKGMEKVIYHWGKAPGSRIQTGMLPAAFSVNQKDGLSRRLTC